MVLEVNSNFTVLYWQILPVFTVDFAVNVI